MILQTPPDKFTAIIRNINGGPVKNKEVKDTLNQRRKLFGLEHAIAAGNTAHACREFDVPRSSYYDWKKSYDKGGQSGLMRKKPIARSHPGALQPYVLVLILDLRKTY
jgi:hypothetical protein